MSTSIVTKVLRWVSNYRGPVAATPANAADVRAGVEDLGSAVYWLKTFMHDAIMGAEQRVIGRSGDQLEITGHGLASNAAVRVFASPSGAYAGTLPSPLAADVVYYVRSVDADHIELSATSGPGAAITLTSGISGDVWVATVPDWSALLISNGTYGSGSLNSLVMWLSGAQTVSGAKTFSDLTMSGANRVKLAARGITRILPAAWMRTSANTIHLFPITTPVGSIFRSPIALPHGCTVTAIHARLARTGLSGIFPAQKIRVTFQRAPITTGTIGTVAQLEDPEGTIATYEGTHTIDMTGIAHVVDTTAYTYFVQLEGELNPEGQSCDLKSLWADVTVSEMSEWA
jgi:hypothetical protein